jgi:hypothetical protein
MTDSHTALTRQLLEWIANSRRTYGEALEVWKSTCPRMSIWEDAMIDGLLDCEPTTKLMSVSDKGRAFLAQTEA